MQGYKLSVIIPVYNVEKYIDKCIESVLNQTIKDIQIILINDGSTDNSLEKCKKWADSYNNIQLINKKNGGQAEARNLGLNFASGEYIFFLDSDDYLPIDALETLYKTIIEKDYDLVCGVSISIFKNGEEIKSENPLNKERFEGSGKDLILKTKYRGIPPMVWLYMFKAKFLKENSIKFPEGLYHEDCEFMLKVMYKASKVRFIDKVTYYQFISENSTMRSVNAKKSKDAKKKKKNIEKFTNEEVKEKKIKKAFNKYIAYLYAYSMHYAMQIGYNIELLFKNKEEKKHILKGLNKCLKYIPLRIAIQTGNAEAYKKIYNKYKRK